MRRIARRLAAEHVARGDPLGWFERLYTLAGSDTQLIPWGDMAPNPNFTSWLERARLDGLGKKALQIACGLGDDAEDLAAALVVAVAGDLREVVFRVQDQSAAALRPPMVGPDPSRDGIPHASGPVQAAPSALASRLNVRNTFDSFVVGDCNHLAFAASMAVADAQGVRRVYQCDSLLQPCLPGGSCAPTKFTFGTLPIRPFTGGHTWFNQNVQSMAGHEQDTWSSERIRRDVRLNERHYGAVQGLYKDDPALRAAHGEERIRRWRRSMDARPPPLNDQHPEWRPPPAPTTEPAIEDVTTKEPPPACIMTGRAYLAHRKGPVKFTPSTNCQSSRVVS